MDDRQSAGPSNLRIRAGELCCHTHTRARAHYASPLHSRARTARKSLSDTIVVVGVCQGNEQNNKYTGEQQANDFAILYKLTVELWPDEKRRPVLFGPDPHSLHGPTGNQLGWIAEWLDGMAAKKVPVHAVTHHQYTEVDPSPAGFTSATKLSLNGAIAACSLT